MRRIFIVPVIAGILLTMSACGAKEETTTASNQPSVKSSDSDQTTTTEKKTTTTESGGDTDTTEGGTGGIGDLPAGLDNDCIAVSTLYVTVMAQSTSLMVPGAVSAEDLDKLDKELEEARSKTQIPDEIADDFETWSNAWAEFGQAMNDIGEGGMLDPANAAKFEEASKIIEAPEVDAASKNIEAYVTEHCATGGLTSK